MEGFDGKSVTVKVPINIAMIKYWGKRNTDLMLALNDSISLTINDLYAETKITASQKFSKNSVKINDTDYKVTDASRFKKVLDQAISILKERSPNTDVDLKFKIESQTNFPVAAGLASSAAGFGAIAFALAKLFNFSSEQLTFLARLGSGSAIRSVLPGLVKWDGTVQSNCESLFGEHYWNELRAIIVVVHDKEKDISSTVGMQTTVETSDLYQHRINVCVPKHVNELTRAFKNKNFTLLAKTIMKDSNQFHAVCLDTTPPLKYMNDISWQLISLANKFNADEVKVGYTFDAGPNCCYYIQEKDAAAFLEILDSNGFTQKSGTVIYSKIGKGPEVI
uniref:Diphosphomevalonate decarboxylase n=1 Tax=Rhabditophanes sp. KR3021 TaxID=114890 RepID=A0AC35UBP1_9BILA